MGRIAVVVIALAGWIVVSACGDKQESAGAAIVRQLDQVDKRQWGRQWNELHPLQQAFIPRELFITCAQQSSTRLQIRGTKVLETYRESVPVPGTDQQVQATAVTVEYTATSGGPAQTVRTTFHVERLDGTWRWIRAADPEPFKNGACP